MLFSNRAAWTEWIGIQYADFKSQRLGFMDKHAPKLAAAQNTEPRRRFTDT
jgi:hypothetical protein